MEITYDHEADAAYIRLREVGKGGVFATLQLDKPWDSAMINLDFDRHRRLVGIEVLDASRQMPFELLGTARELGE